STMKVTVSLGMALLGFYLPDLFLNNVIARRQQSIMRAFPDALDLLLICVESGMSVEAAFQRVAAEIGVQSSELAEEFGLTTAELSYLPHRRPGKPRDAHGGGGEEGRVAAGEADGADDRLLPALPLRGDPWPRHHENHAHDASLGINRSGERISASCSSWSSNISAMAMRVRSTGAFATADA